MENFDQPLDQGFSPGQNDGLQITESVRQYWRQIGAWTMFLAVLLFIVFGLVTLAGLMIALVGGGLGLLSGIFLIGIYSVFLFFPGYYLYLYSSQMKQALAREDNQLLDMAFLNLKRYYRFVGILMIIFIAFYVLFFLVYGAAMMQGMPME